MTKPPQWFIDIYTEAWPMIQAQQRKATTMRPRNPDEYIEILERRIIGTNIELQQALDACKALSETIQKKNERISEEGSKAVETIERLGKDIARQEMRIEELRNEANALKSTIADRDDSLQRRDKEILNLHDRLQIATSRLNETEDDLGKHKSLLTERDKKVAVLQDDRHHATTRADNLAIDLKARDKTIADLESAINVLEGQNAGLSARLTERASQLEQARETIAAKIQRAHQIDARVQILDDAMDRIEMYARAPERPQKDLDLCSDIVLGYVEDLLQRLSNCHEAAQRSGLQAIEEPEADAQG